MTYLFVNNTAIQTYEDDVYSNVSSISISSNSVNNSLNITVNESNSVINATANIHVNAPRVLFSTNNLSVGTANVSANGYTWLPNGVLFQWGTVAANTTVGNITFPIAFPNGLYSITATAQTVNSSLNYTYAAVVIASNTTTANVRTGNTTSRTVYWSAFGS